MLWILRLACLHYNMDDAVFMREHTAFYGASRMRVKLNFDMLMESYYSMLQSNPESLIDEVGPFGGRAGEGKEEVKGLAPTVNQKPSQFGRVGRPTLNEYSLPHLAVQRSVSQKGGPRRAAQVRSGSRGVASLADDPRVVGLRPLRSALHFLMPRSGRSGPHPASSPQFHSV